MTSTRFRGSHPGPIRCSRAPFSLREKGTKNNRPLSRGGLFCFSWIGVQVSGGFVEDGARAEAVPVGDRS